MEPIDIASSTDSESSDWDLDVYKAYNESAVNDTATSAPSSSVHSTLASSSGANNAGQHGSIRKPATNGHSSHANYDLDRQLQIQLSSSNNDGNFDDQLPPSDIKRMLPASLQAFSSSYKPNARAKSVGTSQIRETYGNPNENARQNNVKTHMGESSSRANNDLMNENHGSRILPPSMWSSNAQYGSLSEPYRPSGVVDEQAVVDERHVYREALQHVNQPLNEVDLPDGLLSVSLLRHQKIALAWMIQKENSSTCAGGILADDQGLGKTISMIALIQHHRVSSKPKLDDVKPTVVVDAEKNDEVLITEASSSKKQVSKQKPVAGSLVVCPASVLRQWARELDEKVAEDGRLEVLIYHGGSRTKNPAELASYDVVLTTYAIVGKEVPGKDFDEDEEDQRNGLNFAFASKKRKGVSGMKKKGKKGFGGFATDSSGTLAKVSWLRVILDEAQTIKNSRTQISKACCGLKAKKRWCLSGTPMQNNIDELFSYFRFLKCDPYANYKSFCNHIKFPISMNPSQGYLKLQAVLKIIMLRRTKSDLIDDWIDDEPIANLLPKSIKLTHVDFSPEERSFYQKLEVESRSQFKTYADAGTVNENYKNILLMLLRLRQACDHPLLVKGFTKESISRSSRMAKNLPKFMQSYLLNLLETLNTCCLCHDIPEDAVVTLCGHVFCYQCVSNFLTSDNNTCPSPKCKSPIGPDVVFNKSTLTNSISDDNGLQQDCISFKIKAAVEIIQKSCRSKGSGVEELPVKAIVFSHWTKMLDLFEMALDQNHIEYRRLDGSMSLSSRDHAVNQFNNDSEVSVMLMSLKANNLDLNKLAASHVILLDLWWNPTTEDQAIDRISHTRRVTVSRLAVKDTVEDRISKLQDEKRKMVDSAFGKNRNGTSIDRLTAEELKYLFMGHGGT